MSGGVCCSGHTRDYYAADLGKSAGCCSVAFVDWEIDGACEALKSPSQVLVYALRKTEPDGCLWSGCRFEADRGTMPAKRAHEQCRALKWGEASYAV